MRLLIPVILLGLSLTSLYSQHIPPSLTLQGEYVVGEAPYEFIFIPENQTGDNTVYIICGGYDQDFDGVYNEETDRKASIWRLSTSDLNPTKVAEFDEGYPKFPVKAFNAGDLALIPMADNTVKGFDVTTYEFLAEDPFEGNVTALFNGGADIQTFLQVVGSEGESEILFLVSGMQPLTLDAGSHTTDMALFSSGLDTYLVTTHHDGNFANWYARVGQVSFGFSVTWDYEEIPLGDTPNDIVINYNDGNTDDFVILGNGSHEIYIIDAFQKSLETTLPTGTTGFDGPRNGFFISEDLLLVSTYASEMLLVDMEELEVLRYQIPHKGESIIGDEEGMVILMPFKNDSYETNNTLAIMAPASSVAEEVPFSIAPSVLRESSVITLDSSSEGDKPFSVVSLTGEVVYTGTTIGGTATIERSEIGAAGLYSVVVGGTSNWIAVK